MAVSLIQLIPTVRYAVALGREGDAGAITTGELGGRTAENEISKFAVYMK